MSLSDKYPGYDEYVIRVVADDDYGTDVSLVGCGEYPASSVLSGQWREVALEYFVGVEEAEARYPELEVVRGRQLPTARVPDIPWDGFDPADCGEVWSEEDY